MDAGESSRRRQATTATGSNRALRPLKMNPLNPHGLGDESQQTLKAAETEPNEAEVLAHNQDTDDGEDSEESGDDHSLGVKFNLPSGSEEVRRSTKGKGKGPAKPEKSTRRATIEPGEYTDELLLLDEAANDLLARVRTPEAFSLSVTSMPELWCSAIQHLVENFIKLRNQMEEKSREATGLKANDTILRNNLTLAQADVERLRSSRDWYKKQMLKVAKDLKDLKEKTARALEPPVDTDDEDFEPRIDARRRTPDSTGLASMRSVSGANKRYPDAPDFDGDRSQWEGWYLHVLSKFRQSAVLFSSEQDKIDYIRDHCKLTAFDVIKARCYPTSDLPYISSEEMLQDLQDFFGDFDKVSKNSAELNHPKFGMGITNSKETFDEFYTRFSTVIAPLGFPEHLKISQLKRTINNRLRWKSFTGNTKETYTDLVGRLRMLDQEIRQNDDVNPPKERSGKTPKTNNKEGPSATRASAAANDSNTNSPARGYRYPSHVMARIRKDKLCFKCLKPGHNSKDENAPCKGAAPLNKEQVHTLLATVELEGEAVEGPAENE